MSKTRVDEGGIKRRQEEITALEATIKRLETLKSAKDSAAMQIILEGAKKGREMALNRIEELASYGVSNPENVTEIFQLGGEIKAYKAILNDVGDADKSIEMAKCQIEKRKNIIKQARATEGLVID